VGETFESGVSVSRDAIALVRAWLGEDWDEVDRILGATADPAVLAGTLTYMLSFALGQLPEPAREEYLQRMQRALENNAIDITGAIPRGD
jgi:hypothetical protein